jgi:type II secretion system protein G
LPDEKRTRWQVGDIVLLLATLGVLQAVAIPSIVASLQRSRQIQTMRDIRAIALAVESYAVDSHVYPAGGYDEIAKSKAETISAQVTPTYIKAVPEKDGWGTTFYYGTTSNSQQYQIRSLGADGESNTALSGAVSDANTDIVFENGSFVVYPEGPQ